MSDRIAVVTGAARGIGRSIGDRLLAEGYNVVGVDISDQLAETDFDPVQADLTTTAGIESVAGRLEALGGELHLLVNNAGITRDARLINMGLDDFGAVIEVNLGSVFKLTTRLADVIVDGGSIVNMASRAYLGNFGQFNYSMSKGGVVGLTRALSLELAPRVRVNAIAPGLIATEMSMGIPEDIRKKMVGSIPMGRMGDPNEIADTVIFLAGAGYITGHVIVVGGGRSLSQ
ncbi:MAG: SDR family oxidoreductase [Acidimicrobiia bacterium]|nr:SDR family oxidoreductase [Acidimicrobiia bacterium]